jgi:hypothetical protein
VDRLQKKAIGESDEQLLLKEQNEAVFSMSSDHQPVHASLITEVSPATPSNEFDMGSIGELQSLPAYSTLTPEYYSVEEPLETALPEEINSSLIGMPYNI